MKKRSPLRKQSAKEAKIKAEYRRVCKEIDEDMMGDIAYMMCTSCHRQLSGLSWGHSHNLPKGRFKLLETDKKNISPRCQNFGEHEGCHEKLDDGDIHAIVKFKDFDDIMAYRFENAPEEYNKLVTAITEAGLETNHNYHEEETYAEGGYTEEEGYTHGSLYQ